MAQKQKLNWSKIRNLTSENKTDFSLPNLEISNKILKSFSEIHGFHAKIITVDHEVGLRNAVMKHIKYDKILLCRYHTGAILKKDIEKIMKPELAAICEAEKNKKKK